MALRVKSSVNVYIVEQCKVMLSRRANTGWLDGHLCAPGGHVEEGETPIEAMLREIKEELGVDVNPQDLDFLCVAQRNSKPEQYVAFEFVIKNKGYKYINAEPEKCSELVWVDINDLPKETIPDFKQIVDEALIGGKKYIEIGY